MASDLLVTLSLVFGWFALTDPSALIQVCTAVAGVASFWLSLK